jgi:PAS domain S-box-containing protein
MTLMLAVVAPIAALGIYSQLELRREQVAETHQQARHLRDLVESEQARLVEGIRQLLATLRQYPFIQDADPIACSALMQRLRADIPNYLDLLVTDAGHVVRCSTNPAGVGTAVGDRAYVRRTLATEAFAVGEYIITRTRSRAVLPFALPYRQADGTIAGVVAAMLDLRWLEDYFVQHSLPDHASALLADRNGTVLARVPLVPNLVGTSMPERLLFMPHAGQPGTAEVIGLDGAAEIIAYAPLTADPAGIFIAVGLNKASALAAVNAATVRALIGTALVLLLVLAVLWWGTSRLVRAPIAVLIEAMHRWRQGELSARVGLRDAPHEILVLGRAFDTMAEALQAHQAKLQDSHALLTTIIESIPDPVFAKDRDGRYLLANADTCAVSGTAHALLIGARDRDLYLPEMAAAIEAADRQVMRTGESLVLEERAPHRQRGPRVYLTTKAPLRDTAGRITGLAGLSLDITERKQAEEALRAAKAEAERANLAKSKFLAAASHDLRQPLQSLVLFLGLLQRQRHSPASTRLLGNMEQALDALGLLLHSLLDISRLDAGLIAAQPTTIELRPLLERLAAEYGPRARAKRLRLRVVRSDALVRSDPVLLERILRNLLENGLRYTERGGLLLGCRRRGDRLRLELVDSGIGIAANKLEEIFEEFYQVGNPERDRTKGLGLGLAVVRRLARLLGHELEVRSAPGRGSSFAVMVPLAAAGGPALPQPNPAGEDRTGTVLVVEDEPLVRTGLEAMLQDWGHTVLTAGSVEETVAVLEQGTVPDALITDYRLQAGRTGLDVVRVVHERLGRPIPVTIITGDTAAERMVEAKRAGFRLLHKPVGPAELRRTAVLMLAEGPWGG